MRSNIFITVSFFLTISCISAQDLPAHTAESDTLEVPVRILIIPSMGSLGDTTLLSIHYAEHLLMEYTSSADNLTEFPGIYVRRKGVAGQPHNISAFGTGWRSVGTMIDGRTLNDPMTGIYDMNLFPTEFIGSIEYLPPSRSFLYQRNAVGAAFNIVTQSHIAPAPYSKIRYSEGSDNYSQTDIVFSQDLAAGLNFMGGVQRQFFGHAEPARQYRGRYINMNYRNYLYRTKIRWNFPRLVNISAHYIYNMTDNGLSGGVDIFNTQPGDIFDEREASVRSDMSFQRIRRHDVTVSASGELLPDSLDTTNLTLFYSNHYRDYREAERMSAGTTLLYQNDYRTLLSGFDFNQWLTAGPLRFHAGAAFHDVHVTHSDKTGKRHQRETGAFIRAVFMPLPGLTANLMTRGDWLRESSYTSFGADLTLAPLNFISFTAGAAHSYRHPSLQEIYWADSTLVREDVIVPEAHDFIFTEVSIKPAGNLRATIGASYRYITDPVLYRKYDVGRIFPGVRMIQSDKSETVTGYLKAVYSLGRFTLSGALNYYRVSEEGESIKTLPEFDIRTSLVYRGLLFNGALDLRVKLEAEYITDQFGVDFDPETFFSTRQEFARIGPSGVLHGSVVGKIGSAYLHITYRNITGTEYMITPFYPMPASYLRFGVTWEFLN